MNEVEKMYSNANVEEEFAYLECHRGRSSICCPIEEYEKDDECMGCINSSAMKEVYEYPPFTPEKQLELIKWLSELDMLEIMRTTREDKAWIINSEYGMSGNVYKHTSRMKSFEEALAGLINSLWQDLTKEERKQIKEILK